MRSYHAVYACQNLLNFLSLTDKGLMIFTVNTHSVGITRADLGGGEGFLKICLDLAIKTRIAVHGLLNCGNCRIIISIRLDADPQLSWIDADHLIAKYSAPNVGT